jgi:probable F420-dependent oxidoreductase
MKFGILTNQTDSSMTPIDLARSSEELGFESVFIGDHPIIPVVTNTRYVWTGSPEFPEEYAHFPALFVCLSMMAAVTTRLRIATGVCLVPEHHPIQLSQLVASLDFLSSGRLMFGVGSGWLAEASEIMGVDFKTRWRKTMEYIEAMKEIWVKDVATFEGEYVSFPPIRAWPKPLQKPHPPIFIGAGGPNHNNLPALRRIAKAAQGWFPLPGFTVDQLVEHLTTLRKLCVEAGRDFGEIEISIPVLVEQIIEENDEVAMHRLIDSHAQVGVHRIVLLIRTLTADGGGRDCLKRAAKLCGITAAIHGL